MVTITDERPRPDDDDRWIDEQEVARMFKCSRSLLQKMRWRGDGPSFQKRGRSIRYLLSMVREFFEKYGLRQSTSQPMPLPMPWSSGTGPIYFVWLDGRERACLRKDWPAPDDD